VVESPIVIDVWTVEADRQDELVRVIGTTLERLVVDRSGFVSAEIYESANRDMVLLKVCMRTAHDRQGLTDDPLLQQAYRELRGIATSHRHFYRLARRFDAPEAVSKE
jgi:hypothetical protein